MLNFFCFDAWILISNEESDESNVWFGYDIQNTCGFHLGFHWVSKLMHVTNLANFYWLSNLWIINELENLPSNCTNGRPEYATYSIAMLAPGTLSQQTKEIDKGTEIVHGRLSLHNEKFSLGYFQKRALIYATWVRK